MGRRFSTTWTSFFALLVLITLRVMDVVSWYSVVIGLLLISLFYLLCSIVYRCSSKSRSCFAIIFGDAHVALPLLFSVLLICFLSCLHCGYIPKSMQLTLTNHFQLKVGHAGDAYNSVLPRDIYAADSDAGDRRSSEELYSDLVSKEWESMMQRVRVEAQHSSSANEDPDHIRLKEQDDAQADNPLISKLLRTAASVKHSNSRRSEYAEDEEEEEFTTSSTTTEFGDDMRTSTYVGETSMESVKTADLDEWERKLGIVTPSTNRTSNKAKKAEAKAVKDTNRDKSTVETKVEEEQTADEEDADDKVEYEGDADDKKDADDTDEYDGDEKDDEKATDSEEDEKDSAENDEAQDSGDEKVKSKHVATENKSASADDEAQKESEVIDDPAVAARKAHVEKLRAKQEKLLELKKRLLKERNRDRRSKIVERMDELERAVVKYRVALMNDTLLVIEQFGWYLGVLPREEVEMLLPEVGSFAVRLSKAQLVLSTRATDGFHHFLINDLNLPYPSEIDFEKLANSTDYASIETGNVRLPPLWKVGDNNYTFSDIPSLVKHFSETKEPLSPGSPVQLLHPVSRPPWFVSNDDVKMGDYIGSGYFGSVYKGEYNGSLIAIKTVREDLEEVLRKQFVREGLVLTNYDSPNVVSLRGIGALREPIVLLMELVNGTSLDKHVRELKKAKTPLNVRQKIGLLQKVALAMAYLSEKHETIHRDLSGRNVIVLPDGSIKLADFGLARMPPYRDVSLGCLRPPPPPPSNVTEKGMKVLWVYNQQPGERVPVMWTALEGLRKKTFTTLSDVWSFGILMWEVFSDGMRPYPELKTKALTVNLTQGYRMLAPKGTPREIYDLMRRCWRTDPVNRPNFIQIAIELTEFYKRHAMAEMLAMESYIERARAAKARANDATEKSEEAEKQEDSAVGTETHGTKHKQREEKKSRRHRDRSDEYGSETNRAKKTDESIFETVSGSDAKDKHVSKKRSEYERTGSRDSAAKGRKTQTASASATVVTDKKTATYVTEDKSTGESTKESTHTLTPAHSDTHVERGPRATLK